MAQVNRYDQPAQIQYKNTYVPIPFDDMLKVSLAKAQRQEAADQKTQAFLASVSNYQMTPGKDESEYQDRLNKVRKNVYSISDKYEVGSLPYMRELNKAVAMQSTDPWWRGSKQNAQSYAALVEARNKALASGESGAEDIYQIDTQLEERRNIGTSGLMEKTGNGIYTSPSAYKHVDVGEYLETFIDNAAADSMKFDEQKGQYIVETTQKGLPYQKLGKPLGIEFKVVPDTTEGTEPGTKKVVVDYEKSDIPLNIRNSLAGQQLSRTVQMELDNGYNITADNKVIDPDEYYKQRYIQEALSKIDERVYNDTSVTFDPDDFALAKYKHDLDDIRDMLISPVIVGSEASTLTSVDAINKLSAGLDEKLTQKYNDFERYLGTKGIEYSKGEDGSVVIEGELPDNIEGKDGENHFLEIAKYRADVQHIKAEKKSLSDLYAKAKEAVKLPAGYEYGKDLTRKEKQRLADKASKVALAEAYKDYTSSGEPHFGKVKDLEPWRKKIYDKAYSEEYKKLLSNADPYYKQINQYLEAAAKSEGIAVGVQSVTSKNLKDLLADKFVGFATEGTNKKAGKLGGGAMVLTESGNRRQYSPKDYEDLSSEKKPEVLGYAYIPQDESLKVFYRPYNKEGVQKPIVYADAPIGLEAKLIREGNFTAAEVSVNKQLVKADNTYNDEGFVDIEVQGETNSYSPVTVSSTGKDEDGAFTVFVRKRTPTERSYAAEGDEGTGMWEIVIPSKNDDGTISRTVVTATGQGAAVSKIMKAAQLGYK